MISMGSAVQRRGANPPERGIKSPLADPYSVFLKVNIHLHVLNCPRKEHTCCLSIWFTFQFKPYKNTIGYDTMFGYGTLILFNTYSLYHALSPSSYISTTAQLKQLHPFAQHSVQCTTPPGCLLTVGFSPVTSHSYIYRLTSALLRRKSTIIVNVIYFPRKITLGTILQYIQIGIFQGITFYNNKHNLLSIIINVTYF